MKQQGHFLLLERSEFRDWLKKQIITRKINQLQVHHTASPNYSTRRIINGVAQQDYFACLEGMRNFHVNTEGWSATGQNITTFEDGRIAISLDRDLNQTPAGIRGSNTGAICIENIGNFDKGGDCITDEQRITIVHLYACLAEKFNVPVDTNHIVYHAWFARTGERLNDYSPGKSSKTCPGTNFWGDGNTINAANKNFIPQIKTELARLKCAPIPAPVPSNKNIKKDDEPMTADEKKAFADLQQKVAELVHANSMDIPSYAKKSIDKLTKLKDKSGNPVVNTPNGRSADFYALVTVLDRVGIFDK
ncbi:peptidoglycan recognition family protein [Paenibacillus sp. YPG26]|uniref:peptidoglycan recognition protein family protein n=1 Tax=Paenibacillus sp. YPG26 TaxID=2878915 RepID=UPI00203FABFA|nr:peptidoglycan recognition family protein [Paenibacillus sp. YPG26]USB34350.1 N-acetylmuramoyl-L-alanine amidase [Paenibacillus sp. YPG26]